jgi:hypothetical protein
MTAAAAAALAGLIAIVGQDNTPLRAAARADAPVQVQLTEGDWLEVRGESADYLKVWDHRRERAGFVRRERVRAVRLDEATAPSLRSVLSFLRDEVGHEALAIAYAVLYLRAAPAGPHADVQVELGLVADRLARRASRGGNTADVAHLEVAKSYGIGFLTMDSDGRARTCYDGDGLRRGLGAAGVPGRDQADAALALTRGECTDPAALPSAVAEWNTWRLDVLARTDKLDVPAHVRARLRMRRIEALAYLTWQQHRSGDAAQAAQLASEAIRQLALVDRGQLADEDRTTYDQAVLRASAVRWAAEAPTSKDRSVAKGGLRLAVKAGQPGESCLQLFGKTETPVFERCTYGVVWQRSFQVAAAGNRATVAVQPLPGWTELWVLRGGREGWSADVLTAAVTQPELGYVESAGFTPDGERLLVVREARMDANHFERRFQVLRASSPDLKVDLQASNAKVIAAFRRWSSPSWQAETLSLRGESLR